MLVGEGDISRVIWSLILHSFFRGGGVWMMVYLYNIINEKPLSLNCVLAGD